MKKFATLLVVLSVSLFALGCGDSAPKPVKPSGPPTTSGTEKAPAPAKDAAKDAPKTDKK